MDQVVIEDLTATIDRTTPGAISARFTGRSSSRDAVAALAPLFERLLAEARPEGRTVVLRFEALEYFNSSTIAALVRFIRTAQESGVRLEVVYDGKQRWQAMSFDALRRALRPLEADGAGPEVTFRDA